MTLSRLSVQMKVWERDEEACASGLEKVEEGFTCDV